MLVFFIILITFLHPAKLSDMKRNRLISITGIYKHELDEELEKPFAQRFLFPMFTAIMKNISRFLPKNKGKDKNKTDINLKLAGIQLTPNEFNAAKLMFSCAFIVAALIISVLLPVDTSIQIFIVILSVLISLIAPIYFMKFRISSRQDAIRSQLPDVMDLLSVTIEAGLGFDSALVRIGARLEGPLVDEMGILLSEIQLGRPRREALKNLAQRSTVEELQSFVSAIIQADQLGIPIKNVLRLQSQQLRAVRRQKAEERAMKAPVKMMIPLVVFILPVLFIILLGPTVLQVMTVFDK